MLSTLARDVLSPIKTQLEIESQWLAARLSDDSARPAIWARDVIIETLR
jgi:hypothetical protein